MTEEPLTLESFSFLISTDIANSLDSGRAHYGFSFEVLFEALYTPFTTIA